LRAACSFFALDPSGKMEEADLKPNLLKVLGGSGGGVSSDSVLPVLCLFVEAKGLFMYFARMKRSMAVSASSASIGTGALLFWGLYVLLDEILPTFFMF
jgi:hypothetical protein